MRSPYSNSFLEVVSNVADGTQPSSTLGTQLTPGENTYGSYVEMIGSVAGTTLGSDAYEVEIELMENFVSAAARDTIVTIGVDESGGTTYTDWTIDHLMASCAARYQGVSSMTPHSYRFPIRVAAGSSIAAKASVNNATVGTLYATIRLKCKPTHPDLLRVGSFVETFGATTASSSGTAVTPGTTSEGAWVQLGNALTRPLWYWDFGFGVNDATMGYLVYHVDIGVGDASNKKIAIRDAPVASNGAEMLSKPHAGTLMDAASGDIVYGRAQCSNTPDSNTSLIAYGVGG